MIQKNANSSSPITTFIGLTYKKSILSNLPVSTQTLFKSYIVLEEEHHIFVEFFWQGANLNSIHISLRTMILYSINMISYIWDKEGEIDIEYGVYKVKIWEMRFSYILL